MEDQREHIHSMLSTIERYNPGNLGELTSYLKNTVRVGDLAAAWRAPGVVHLAHSAPLPAQCDAGVFDIEACLAILKLFVRGREGGVGNAQLPPRPHSH